MMRILLVKDEKDLADILKKGLEEEQYNVDTCFDGEEGLYMAEEFSYDVRILDITLPESEIYSGYGLGLSPCQSSGTI